MQTTCSPRRMTFCFLCQRPFRMMLPYTSTSLKRKKTFGWGFRRPCFIRRPSPIRTRPGLDRELPEAPNEFSTALIRSLFSLSNVNRSMVVICCSSPISNEQLCSSSVFLNAFFVFLNGDAMGLPKFRLKTNTLDE